MLDWLESPQLRQMCQAAIQADLDAVGIKVSLVPGTAKQVITKLRARQHQMAMND
jgi:hypothetical protein